MVDMLECGDVETINGESEASDSGATKPVARTRAKASANQTLLLDVMGLLREYTCPKEGCPELRIQITIEKVQVRFLGPTLLLDGSDGFEYKAAFKWSARIRCSARMIMADPSKEILEDQELLCAESAIFVGEDTGKGEAATRPQAEKEAVRDALVSIPGKLAQFCTRVRCPERCPRREFNVSLDPPGAPTCKAPAEEGGNWKCEIKQKYRVKIECLAAK